MYVEPSLKKEPDIGKALRKKFIALVVIGFVLITGYNGYVAYNMKSDNELMQEEISKANSTFENIKILNARILSLEHKHEMLSNCVDYLEMQFIRSRNVESTSAEYSRYKDKCQNAVSLSYNFSSKIQK